MQRLQSTIFLGQRATSATEEILVGAINDGIGRAYLFDTTDGSLLHSFDDPTANSSDYFAHSVALDGNYIVIGAFGDDTLLPLAGQAYVFDATTGSLVHTLDNPEPKQQRMVRRGGCD